MAQPNVIQVQTQNGTEFVNLSLVRRFVPGADGTLELRFGQAETLVLTGAPARQALAWVTAQAESLKQLYSDAEPEPHTAAKTQVAQPTQSLQPPPKRLQLMALPPAFAASVAPEPPQTVQTLQASCPDTPEPTPTAVAERVRLTPGTPSPTINRSQWAPKPRR